MAREDNDALPFLESKAEACINAIDIIFAGVNKFYIRHRYFLIAQSLLIACLAYIAFDGSKISRDTIMGTDAAIVTYIAVQVGIHVIMVARIILRPRTEAEAPEHRGPSLSLLRAGALFIVRSAVSNGSEYIQKQAELGHWVDGRMIATVVLLNFQLAAIIKHMALREDFGVGDALISTATVLSGIYLGSASEKYLIVMSDIVFTIIVLYREHRARLREQRLLNERMNPLQEALLQ